MQEESYRPKETGAQEEEPLINITEVLGFDIPEKVEEPEFETPVDTSDPYTVYTANPTQRNLHAVVKSLKPTIDSVIASAGGAGNPQIAARARVVAAKAVQSFDPTMGVSLKTWVSNQERQLNRDIRRSKSIMSVPDGVQLDAYLIYRKETEFEDENGREPTLDELADLTKLSTKRIESVRQKLRPVIEDNSTESETGESLLGVKSTDYTNDAIDYVYNDSDTNDKKLLEYLIGYGGQKPMDSDMIMKKLKLTPVQLTRRKARLSMRINDILDDFQKL